MHLSSCVLGLLVVFARSAAYSVQPEAESSPSLVADNLVKVFVVDLPRKYNVDLIKRQACNNTHVVEGLFTNTLGDLSTDSLDLAHYRKTPYYGLEIHLHITLLSSPLRVFTAEEADVVHIPFYATSLLNAFPLAEGCEADVWTEESRISTIHDFYAEVKQHAPLLGTKPHWMPVAEIEWLYHKGCGEGFGLPLLCHPLAKHITFTMPEALTQPLPGFGHQRFASHTPQHRNVVPTPYFGHVHRMNMPLRAALLADDTVMSNKTLDATMSFGSSRGVKFREQLLAECNSRPQQCQYVPYMDDYLEIARSYERAWFCVQPMGDTPTRSALSDCFATGLAIPLVFDEFLVSLLPFSDVVDYSKISVYMPYELASGHNVSFLEYLKGYSTETRAGMLRSLQRVSQVFQYAAAPNHLLVRLDQLAVVHPLDDAFTATIKAVVRHNCLKSSHRRHAHRCRVAKGASIGGLVNII